MSTNINLNSFQLSNDDPLRRDAPSDVVILQPSFWDEYDHSTLFYDAIELGHGKFKLIAPPLFNLKRTLLQRLGRIAPRAKVTVQHRHSYDEISVTLSRHETSAFRSGMRSEFGVEPSLIESEFFSGKRVLYTQNKDNELRWIKDWMIFHHEHHGANALMLFDNGSSLYSIDELMAELSAIRGFEQVLIVPSHHRYMPGNESCTNKHSCLFLQSALMLIARLRWLSDAASVLSCDIDELVVHPNGKSIFSAAESNLFGAEVFNGSWTYPEKTDSPISHFDHHFIRQEDPVSRSKYCYRPNSYMGLGELHVHTIHRTLRNQILNQFKKTSEFHYLHCTGISTYRKDASDTGSDAYTSDPFFKTVLHRR